MPFFFQNFNIGSKQDKVTKLACNGASHESLTGNMAVPVQRDISQKEIAAEASQLPTQKWYFSREEIEFHTPSRSDGIDYKQEEHLRKLYCSFLQELGIELKV